MTLFKAFFLLCLANLPACASNTTDNSNMLPKLNLETNFLLKRSPHNQTISIIKDNNPTQALYKVSNPKGMDKAAITFLQTYRNDFLINNPKKEFSIVSNKTDDLGFTRIKLNQNYQGVPVWKGVLSLHFDRRNELYIVRGEYFPTPENIDINAGLSSGSLFQKAATLDVSIIQKDYTLNKIIYFKNNIKPRLAYELQPIRRATLTSNSFILDAITGEVLNRLSNIQTLH
jgi:Zn-dependent metalloprotease